MGSFPNTHNSDNSPNIQLLYSVICKISKILKYTTLKFLEEFGKSGYFPNAWESDKVLKYLWIWDIPKIHGNLGNSPKFPEESEGSLFLNYKKNLKCLTFWEISQIPRQYSVICKISKILKIYHPQIPKYLVNIWESGDFPKCLGIWKIPQISFFSKSIVAVGSYSCCIVAVGSYSCCIVAV